MFDVSAVRAERVATPPREPVDCGQGCSIRLTGNSEIDKQETMKR